MRGFVNVLVLGLVFLVGAGVVIAGVVKVRQTAGRVQCENNLKESALGLGNYCDSTEGKFPLGTVPNYALAPEWRLSWYVDTFGYYEQCGRLLIDRSDSWAADENRNPQVESRCDDEGLRWEKHPARLYKLWTCPANPHHAGPDLAGFTHFVGIAGVGQEIAASSSDDPRAGVFGYDRQTKLEDIKDGTSHTLMLMETALDNGPWTAGGPPTVRGLDPSRQPYLGAGRQFGGTHPGLTGAAFADGSVQFLRNSISPNVLEALATVAGAEDIPANADPKGP